jgi:hypothetical protein
MDHTRVAACIKAAICPHGQMIVHDVPRKIAEAP